MATETVDEDDVGKGVEKETKTPLKLPPAIPNCEMCNEALSKYRCPACERRTCSAACVTRHKVEFACTGKRPRADFVAPLRAFTDSVVLRDFGFLEDVDAAIDRANRDYRIQGTELGVHQNNRHRQRTALVQACAAMERNVQLVLAPSALDLARKNTSRVVFAKGVKGQGKGKGRGKGKGKGKGKHATESVAPCHIAWRVEWRFGGRVLVDKGLAEYEILGPSLRRFLENTWLGGATRHMLVPYVEAGAEQLEVYLEQRARVAWQPEWDETSDEEEDEEDSVAVEDDYAILEVEGQDDTLAANRASEHGLSAAARKRARSWRAVQKPAAYVKMDQSQSLRQNLLGRAVLEFPVLHVALPSERHRFE